MPVLRVVNPLAIATLVAILNDSGRRSEVCRKGKTMVKEIVIDNHGHKSEIYGPPDFDATFISLTATAQLLSRNTEDLTTNLQSSDRNGVSYLTLLDSIRSENRLLNLAVLLKTALEKEIWRSWRWRGQQFTSPSLVKYIEDAPPHGLGSSVQMVTRLIADDPEAVRMLRKSTTAHQANLVRAAIKKTAKGVCSILGRKFSTGGGEA